MPDERRSGGGDPAADLGDRPVGDAEQDGSGSIDRQEFKNALQTFGFNLSDRFIDMLIRRFDVRGKQMEDSLVERGQGVTPFPITVCRQV